MALNPVLSHAGCAAALNAVTALLNTGTIEFRDGTQPADPDTTATGVLLATLTFGATAFGAGTTARPSVATANSITSGTAGNSSTVTWTRWKASGGAAIFDCSAGASACDINLTPSVITSGQTVALTSLTLSHP